MLNFKISAKVDEISEYSKRKSKNKVICLIRFVILTIILPMILKIFRIITLFLSIKILLCIFINSCSRVFKFY